MRGGSARRADRSADDRADAEAIMRAGLVGRVVTKVMFDAMVTLQTVDPPRVPAWVHLICPFDLTVDGVTVTVDPSSPGPAAAPLAALHQATFEAVELADGGWLTLRMDGSRSIKAGPDGWYEGWNYVSDDQGLIVSMPSGGLAIWEPKPSP